MNRKFQKAILTELRGYYPHHACVDDLFAALGGERYFDEDGWYHSALYNMAYLMGHGLIDANVETDKDNADLFLLSDFAKITPAGLDFLEDDGGISAILNTVTVKFDVENIRSLVEAGLLKANLPEEKRSTLLQAIKNAPATVLQTAITKLVEVGMSDPVGSIKALASALGISV
jgi:hypothetical protein